MACPIFDETMVELSWPQLEEEAKANPPVILPVGIIEEHGPHMDLAPDVYLAHQWAKDVKKLLAERSLKVLIAPPMYWGVSPCTEASAGTSSGRPQTMLAIMLDRIGLL